MSPWHDTVATLWTISAALVGSFGTGLVVGYAFGRYRPRFRGALPFHYLAGEDPRAPSEVEP